MPARLGVTNQLRVLITADAVGGVWQYTLELASGLAEQGVEVVLAVLGPSPDERRLKAAQALPGLRIVDTGLPLDWTAETEHAAHEAGVALARLARDVRPDIVQLHSPAFAADVGFPAPCVAVTHSCVATWWRAVRNEPMPEDFAWRMRRMARGLSAADAVVAVSRSFASMLTEVYGSRTSIAVVPNGKRPAYYPSVRRHRCAFTAGRLWDPAKNIGALDRAAGRLDAPVYAAGPIAGPHGIVAHLTHLRHLGELGDADMCRWYASSAVFVSAARYEPFGLSVLEAAQAGAALVLSDIPTFRELWDGAAVFVADDDLASALQDVLDDIGRATELGELARQRAARYDRMAMVQSMLELYDTLLTSSRLRRA